MEGMPRLLGMKLAPLAAWNPLCRGEPSHTPSGALPDQCNGSSRRQSSLDHETPVLRRKPHPRLPGSRGSQRVPTSREERKLPLTCSRVRSVASILLDLRTSLTQASISWARASYMAAMPTVSPWDTSVTCNGDWNGWESLAAQVGKMLLGWSQPEPSWTRAVCAPHPSSHPSKPPK